MKVAALYDVHGNLPALEAVLAEVAAFAPDLIVVGGDVVPGPMPRECLLLLLTLRPVPRFIHGNGETDVVAFFDGSAPSRVPEAFHPTMRWVAARLRPADRDTLAAWPLTTSVRIEGLGDVLFCHATPNDDNRWNLHGIGICLVGDFTAGRPSQRQMDALVTLVRNLMREYDIPARSVVPHSGVSATVCPGPRFPWDEFKARLR